MLEEVMVKDVVVYSLIFKSYLSLVAMATQTITRAPTPTIKARMMIQPGHMGEQELLRLD